MKLNFQWKQKTAQFQTGESLYLNGIRVADYGWNGLRSRTGSHDNNDWVGGALLPQATKTLYDDAQDELKAKLERLVTMWFEKAIAKEE